MKTPDLLSRGIWAWLMIVEKEAEKLSPGGQNALKLLREDLEMLATDLPEPPPADRAHNWDARQVIEAISLLRRAVQIWPYTMPELADAERAAVEAWLDDPKNHPGPHAHVAALRQITTEGDAVPNTDTITVFPDRAEEWRWTRRAPNHEPVSDSAESYTRKDDAIKAAEREAEGTDAQVVVAEAAPEFVDLDALERGAQAGEG